jgi:hypothetical protein
MKKVAALCVALALLLPLTASSQFFNFKKEYKPGFYVKGEQKVEGYIYFSEIEYDQFLFKKELDGKKEKKRVNECDGFEFDNRKFKVITNIEMKAGVWNVAAPEAFGEVIVNGPVTLYKVYYSVGNGNPNAPGASQVTNWYLEKKGTGKYVHAHPNKKKFREMARDFFKDRPDIVAKIEDQTYELEHIQDIVNTYNVGQ